MSTQQASTRHQSKRRFQLFIGNHNSKARLVLKRVLRNQIGKVVSALEITKERFLICKKKMCKGAVCVF